MDYHPLQGSVVTEQPKGGSMRFYESCGFLDNVPHALSYGTFLHDIIDKMLLMSINIINIGMFHT